MSSRTDYPSSVLVAQTSFLGDLVLTTPLLEALRQQFHRTRIVLLCTPGAAALFHASRDVDDVIAYDKRGIHRGFGGLHAMARHLRDRRFGLALAPHKSFRTALLLALARIPRRVGFRESAGWFFYHVRVMRDPELHEVERNLSLLRGIAADVPVLPRQLSLTVDEQSRRAAAEMFRRFGIAQKGRKLYFGINAGSVWPTKRWHVEGFAAVARALKEKYECEILLFGSQEDRVTTTQIESLCGGGVALNLAGSTNLQELAAALDWCDLFITNDSAPMHMAVARGIPVVALFCATTPSLGFYPYSSNAVVLQKGIDCRPCSSHGGRRCPLGTEACIRLLDVPSVLGAVDESLARSAPRGSYAYMPEFVTL